MSFQPQTYPLRPYQLRPYQLRPYQQQAVDATLLHFRSSDAAALITLPTGAGKSLVIAELARLARRRILVLAHVKELVEQNHSKYASYGFQASVFAAGLNRKETQTQVVFGSVQSVARNLDRFADEFSLLIIDECHRVSSEEDSQYQQIIKHLKQHNPQLKVLGLTATPYRLDSGWIYQQHQAQNCLRSSEPKPFHCCIFELPLRHMIDAGFLTPVTLLDAPIALYDFEQLRPGAGGAYRETDLNRILQGSKRATARIIAQVIDRASDRQGVMIFASTVAHAKEILTYLPADNSAMIIGDMHARARDSVIEAFKSRQFKFLVNVSILTTGFDAPHVDLIAVLRPTESVGLYQQIIGRGLRLSPGKTDCLVLDYAGNNHDLFRPEIGDPKPDSDAEIVEIPCPLCQHSNQFWGKIDSDGHLIEHYGRRCQGLVETVITEEEMANTSGKTQGKTRQCDSQKTQCYSQKKQCYSQKRQCDSQKKQCDYRYRFKECGQCGAENDIAARQCHQCRQLLVDPDQKLKEALQLRDAKVLRCSGISFEVTRSKDQQPLLRICYHDEDGDELSELFGLASKAQQGAFYHNFSKIHLKPHLQQDQPLDFRPSHPQQVVEQQQLFRAPDFVIARKQGRYWQIRDKIFDYDGCYRRAHELG